MVLFKSHFKFSVVDLPSPKLLGTVFAKAVGNTWEVKPVGYSSFLYSPSFSGTWQPWSLRTHPLLAAVSFHSLDCCCFLVIPCQPLLWSLLSAWCLNITVSAAQLWVFLFEISLPLPMVLRFTHLFCPWTLNLCLQPHLFNEFQSYTWTPSL